MNWKWALCFFPGPYSKIHSVETTMMVEVWECNLNSITPTYFAKSDLIRTHFCGRGEGGGKWRPWFNHYVLFQMIYAQRSSYWIFDNIWVQSLNVFFNFVCYSQQHLWFNRCTYTLSTNFFFNNHHTHTDTHRETHRHKLDFVMKVRNKKT